MNDRDLRAHGACADRDTAIFFPENEEGEQRAREICAGCPVRTTCLAQALARQEPYGIWGGTTGDERRRMHRELKLPTAAQLRRNEKRETARRMYACGRSRTAIAQYLHVSGGVVKKYLTEPAK